MISGSLGAKLGEGGLGADLGSTKGSFYMFFLTSGGHFFDLFFVGKQKLGLKLGLQKLGQSKTWIKT